MKKVVLLVAWAGLVTPLLKAQTKLSDTTLLREVRVQTGTIVEVNRNRVPVSVSVITRKQIEESGESALLPVLNGRVPGLFVTERGITGFGVSQNAGGQITIRGIGENPTTGVLMLIDGHPQFMGIMGHPLSDSYLASAADKVEVIRGAASILYGTNAMGGVINIITRKNLHDGWSAEAGAMYGSYNTWKLRAAAGYKKKQWSAFFSTDHDQTDGHRRHSSFSMNSFYGKVVYEVSDKINAQADFGLSNFKNADPGPDTLGAPVATDLNITRGYGALTVLQHGDKWSATAKLYYNFGIHDISDGFHSHDNNYGLSVAESGNLFKRNIITLGVDLMNFGGIANTKAGSMIIPFVDTTVHERAVYALIQQGIGSKLTITTGLRYHYNNVYGGIWIPMGGLTFTASANTGFKASVSKGFRSPTIRELFMFNHNPALGPERVYNYEISAEQYLAARRFRLEVTLFCVTGKDVILTGAMGQLFNGGNVKNKGMELATEYHPSNAISAMFTYSYTDMKSPLYGTPKQHLFLSGSWHIKKISISPGFDQIIDLNTQATPGAPVHLESYSLLNLKVGWQVNEHFKCFVSGENLLNQQYETLRYYPMPGATVLGGISFQL